MGIENEITGEITALAFGGEGILRHENLVIFVPFTAIGDRIVCRVTTRKRNFAFAELVKLLDPGPERIKPTCPYFGTCGGCQLQHLRYTAQLEYKRQAVEDALKRIGTLPLNSNPSCIPAQTQWAYRRHITLTLRSNSHGSFSVGYIAKDHHSLIQISQCPIFTQSQDPIIPQIAEFANQLICPRDSEGRAMVLKNTSGKYLVSFHFKHKPNNAIEVANKFMQVNQNWSGIVLKAPKFSQGFGLLSSQTLIEGLTISFSSDAFIQNHPEQSLKIYRAITEIARKVQKGTILDLYCGIGITSLLMVQAGHSVVGVESNEDAVKLAHLNAKINQIEKATFIKGDVKELLPDLLKQFKPDLIVINPPREGLEKGIVKNLVENLVKEVVYISCMPATLARDLKELCQDHYQVTTCQSYDMFPQTAHVETLVHLTNET